VRPIVGLSLCAGLASACGGDGGDGRDGRETAVVPVSIEVSDDRRMLSVVTFYANSLFCGKQPGGVHVEINDGRAVISAVLKEVELDGADCTAECGTVTQTITLPEPLPTGVRFEAPPDADPGCGSGIPHPQVTTTIVVVE
jgi:hypothetical protein